MNENKSGVLRVAIVGAGLGGLCLAQNLRARGLSVDVYERDHSPWDRPQGYRLHLDADGINALHDSLSRDLFGLFEATAMKAQPFTTIVDTSFGVRARRPHDEHGGTSTQPHDGGAAHVNVNRATLREILLARLEACVHFGKELIAFEEGPDAVEARFADGSRVRADVLVGADGIRSPIRRQRAPHAATQDSGVRAIYGRIPLSAAVAVLPRQAVEDVFTVAVDERRCFLGLGPVRFPTRPELAGAALTPPVRLHAQDDYVVSIVGGRREHFGRSDAELRALSSHELQAASKALLAGWPSATLEILAQADPTAFFLVEMHTSIPVGLSSPSRSTLLGDAIHAMTPTLGRGANLALRDAANLGRHLGSVADGTAELSEALAAYEAEMVRYGFDVVRTAAAMGTRLMGQEPLPTTAG